MTTQARIQEEFESTRRSLVQKEKQSEANRSYDKLSQIAELESAAISASERYALAYRTGTSKEELYVLLQLADRAIKKVATTHL